MATQLETNLNAILNEKNNKIIPSNIKAGVTIFDVTGTYEGTGGSGESSELPLELRGDYGNVLIESNENGKNLFNAYGGYDYSTGTSNATLQIVNTNKIIVTNEWAWCRICCTIPNLKPNTEYMVSADITNTSGVNCGFYFYDNGERKHLETSTNFKAKCSFLTDENGKLQFQFCTNFSGDTSTAQVIYDNIQLEEGKVATEYTPYTPPLYIRHTALDGIIQIKLDKKNLFNANGGYDYATGTYYVDYNIVNNNKIIITNSSKWDRLGCTINGLKPNTEYTVSSDITNPAGLNCGFWVTNEREYVNTSTNFKAKCSFLTDENGTLHFTFFTNYSDTISTAQVTYDNIQLEEGTEATKYTPYTSINLMDENTAIITVTDSNKTTISLI